MIKNDQNVNMNKRTKPKKGQKALLADILEVEGCKKNSEEYKE